MATNAKEYLAEILRLLPGERLSFISYFGNGRVLHFGDIVRNRKRYWVGQYALHIQCPWRLNQNGRLITGSGDYYNAGAGFERTADDWPKHPEETLVHEILLQLFPRDMDRTWTNRNGRKFAGVVAPEIDVRVKRVTYQESGDLTLTLSKGFRFETFINDSENEHWRFLFPHDRRKRHAVVEGKGEVLIE